MIIFDFFSGTGSSTQAFKDAGHTVITFELDPYFEATEHTDVMLLKASSLVEKYGQPDFVWASPPCTSFSVASIGHHWISGGDSRMKPTDLWGVVPNWTPRITCKNGDTCHVSAPRGARTGTQGLKGAKERSRVPYELGKEILNAL